MRRLHRTAVAVLLVAGLYGLVVAPVRAQEGELTRISFRVTLSSRQSILEQVGSGGDTTYGWNELTGTATTTSGDVEAQMLGNVDYVDGSGEFFGFLTLSSRRSRPWVCG